MVVVRNPSHAIRDEYPEVDWSGWPPAEDNCFVKEYLLSLSGDSSQQSWHVVSGVGPRLRCRGRTCALSSWHDHLLLSCPVLYPPPPTARLVQTHQAATMEQANKQLGEMLPWVRSSTLVSDNCGDFHSAAAIVVFHELGRITGIRTKRVLFFESGEGKSPVDALFGRLNQAVGDGAPLSHTPLVLCPGLENPFRLRRVATQDSAGCVWLRGWDQRGRGLPFRVDFHPPCHQQAAVGP